MVSALQELLEKEKKIKTTVPVVAQAPIVKPSIPSPKQTTAPTVPIQAEEKPKGIFPSAREFVRNIMFAPLGGGKTAGRLNELLLKEAAKPKEQLAPVPRKLRELEESEFFRAARTLPLSAFATPGFGQVFAGALPPKRGAEKIKLTPSELQKVKDFFIKGNRASLPKQLQEYTTEQLKTALKSAAKGQIAPELKITVPGKPKLLPERAGVGAVAEVKPTVPAVAPKAAPPTAPSVPTVPAAPAGLPPAREAAKMIVAGKLKLPAVKPTVPAAPTAAPAAQVAAKGLTPAEIPEAEPISTRDVKRQVRIATGQFKPKGKPIDERIALRRSMQMQQRAAKKAAIDTKRKTKEMLGLVKRIKAAPIEAMNFEEKAAIEEVKKDLKTTRTLDGLRDIYKKVVDLTTTGKTKFLSTVEGRKQALETVKDTLIKTHKTEPLAPFPRTEATLAKTGRQKVAEAVGTFRFKTLRPSRVFDILDGGQDFKGPHNDFFVKGAERAENAKLRSVDSRREAMVNFIKEQGLSLEDLNKSRVVEGIPVKVDEMLSVYAALRNREKMLALMFGNNWSIEFMEKVEAQMSPQEKAVIERIMQEYNENWPRIRQSLLEFTDGKTDLGRAVNYTPIKRLAQNFEPTEQELAKELLERQNLKRAFAERGFTKERVKNIPPQFQAPIRMGEVALWMDQLEKQEHFINYGNLIRQFQSVIRDPKFRNSLRENPKFGEAALDTLEKWTNRVANPSIYKAYGTMEKAAQVLRGNAAMAYLGFNLVTMGKQFPSIALFLRDVPVNYLLGATADMITKYPSTIKFVQERSPQLKNRSIERELEEFKQSNPKGFAKIVKKVGMAGMKGIMEVDKFVTHLGWLGKYNQLLDQGTAPPDAAELADRAVLETQPAAHAKDIAEIYTTNEFLNWWLQFSNQTNQIYNIISYDIPMKARAANKWEAARAGMGVILSAAMIWMLSKGRVPQDKEDLLDMAADASLNYIPGIGSYLNSSRKGFGDGLPPALMPLKVGVQTAQAAATAATHREFKQREKAKLRAFEKALEFGALARGVPFAQPRRTLKGLMELQKGQTSDLRRLIFSKGAIAKKKKRMTRGGL